MNPSENTPTTEPSSAAPSPSESAATVAAGVLAPWEVAALPPPPMPGWKLWIGLLGPGVVLAGTSIGTGEWLFGPGVAAQYGASLFWLAMTSIVMQGFCNLMMMRYAIYCGEPVIVGILRTRPGPMFWMAMFAVLDIAAIFPYNAANAAVPLAAAIRGYLPQTESDPLVKGLGFAIFLAAFIPLIFGGTVYRMLEKIMTAKLVLVLGYLSIVAVLMVSSPVLWDVTTGFFSFGTVPLRPETLIVGRHFTVTHVEGNSKYVLRGTWEPDGTLIGEFLVPRDRKQKKVDLRNQAAELSPSEQKIADDLLDRTKPYRDTTRFFLEIDEGPEKLVAEGNVVKHHYWEPTKLAVGGAQYASLPDVPHPYRERFENHMQHEGLAYVGLIGYVSEHGRLPALNWAMIVSFIGIAGAGGLANTMFSNYARDKGWGMGCHVGAIPSAIGGVSIGLSHTGKVFPLDEVNLPRWRGWMSHIRRDQALWMVASVIGMALPCMLSLEFIRNATVTGDRVAAMSAEGIASRYPDVGLLFWFLTLACGFLVLAPGQVSAGDQIARRWTDMIWTVRSGKRHRQSAGGKDDHDVGRSATPSYKEDVRYVYYSILAGYGVTGLVVLWLLPPVLIAQVSVVLQNIALGSVSLLSLYVNRALMPKELRPGWFHQIGVVACGVFFLGISIALLVLL